MGWVPAVLGRLKAELHADRGELGLVLDANLLQEDKLVHGSLSVEIFYPLEEEQLVGLLLIHDEILAADDGKDLLVLGHLHGDDLVGFPFGRLEQGYKELALGDLFVGIDVVELDSVALTDQEGVHVLDW